ncbi:bifunctional folylpolyglutamate synthase/dihydrofolate synthase [Saccharicrinis sp. FJH62]|uniref:bifunctional folylpolyglutamate synthase/dihydrofolate synthase n=1 Tax=Saccharicrinis sp. FJH62 TaxID=3344657 RepID=UPI0035D45500
MNYEETLQYLFSSLPMYQRVGKAAYKANLNNTHALDAYFDHPHREFKTVHVAGTNGKGTVSHILAAVFQLHGFKTGLYTSPHLFDFRERIKINGEPVSKESVIDFVAEHKALFENIQPSFFEMTVAMAFEVFKDEGVDIAIIETGMGGRLDSTNIISPLVSVITNIGYDHTQFLGSTLEAIAGEKAGIIKPGIPVVIGETQKETEPVFKSKALESGSTITFADQRYKSDILLRETFSQTVKVGEKTYKTDLTGSYQRKNLTTALAALDVLKSEYYLNDDLIANALTAVKSITGLKGRWDVISESPDIICETSHNEAGIREMVEQLKMFGSKQIHIITGMVNDKDPDAILPLLPQKARYYFTRAQVERAMPETDLQNHARRYALNGNSYPKVDQAIDAARKAARPDDVIVITGSIFLIADALEYLN